MPKQVYKIERFDGGLNDNSDPRDIGETQSESLTNWDISNVGKISIGQELKYSTGMADFTPSGYHSTFAFSSDYDNLAGGGSTSYDPAHYIAFRKDGNTFKIGLEGTGTISATIGGDRTITGVGSPIFIGQMEL